jgi:hypothetical protein
LPFSIFPHFQILQPPFHKQKPTWPGRLRRSNEQKPWMNGSELNWWTSQSVYTFPSVLSLVEIPSSVIRVGKKKILSRVMR